jgi:hypothetical protein
LVRHGPVQHLCNDVGDGLQELGLLRP